MAKKKYPNIQRLRVKKGASLEMVYAAAKKAITAADLQKFTVEEEMIPAEQVLAEMKAIHKDVLRQRRRKNKP